MGKPMKIVSMGSTSLAQSDFESYLTELSYGEFSYKSYHLLDRNCNHFSALLLDFLTGAKIPEYIEKMPLELISTPLGQLIRPHIETIYGPSSIPHAPIPKLPWVAYVLDVPPVDQAELSLKHIDLLKEHWEATISVEDFPVLYSMLECPISDLESCEILEDLYVSASPLPSYKDAMAFWMYLCSIQKSSPPPQLFDALVLDLDDCMTTCSNPACPKNSILSALSCTSLNIFWVLKSSFVFSPNQLATLSVKLIELLITYSEDPLYKSSWLPCALHLYAKTYKFPEDRIMDVLLLLNSNLVDFEDGNTRSHLIASFLYVIEKWTLPLEEAKNHLSDACIDIQSLVQGCPEMMANRLKQFGTFTKN